MGCLSISNGPHVALLVQALSPGAAARARAGDDKVLHVRLEVGPVVDAVDDGLETMNA